MKSPWVDFAVTGETMVSNQGKEALFSKDWVKDMAGIFLGGSSPQDPYANPLHADLSGLGPVYIQVGGHELLLDDSRRLAEHAEKGGRAARHLPGNAAHLPDDGGPRARSRRRDPQTGGLVRPKIGL